MTRMVVSGRISAIAWLSRWHRRVTHAEIHSYLGALGFPVDALSGGDAGEVSEPARGMSERPR